MVKEVVDLLDLYPM